MPKHRKLHKDINIPFTAGGVRFKAIGFLSKGEWKVSAEEMFARTVGKNGGFISEDHRRLIIENIDQLPIALQRPFLTVGPDPNDPETILSYKYAGKEGWAEVESEARDDYDWLDDNLVVCYA